MTLTFAEKIKLLGNPTFKVGGVDALDAYVDSDGYSLIIEMEETIDRGAARAVVVSTTTNDGTEHGVGSIGDIGNEIVATGSVNDVVIISLPEIAG